MIVDLFCLLLVLAVAIAVKPTRDAALMVIVMALLPIGIAAMILFSAIDLFFAKFRRGT